MGAGRRALRVALRPRLKPDVARPAADDPDDLTLINTERDVIDGRPDVQIPLREGNADPGGVEAPRILAQREGRERLYSSLVKDTMKRLQPQFNEEYHGYGSFHELLEDAQKHKLITLRRDERSGTYVIRDVHAKASG